MDLRQSVKFRLIGLICLLMTGIAGTVVHHHHDDGRVCVERSDVSSSHTQTRDNCQIVQLDNISKRVSCTDNSALLLQSAVFNTLLLSPSVDTDEWNVASAYIPTYLFSRFLRESQKLRGSPSYS